MFDIMNPNSPYFSDYIDELEAYYPDEPCDFYIEDEDEEDDDYMYSDDAPSWKELMQDNYPTCDDGTVFSTMSGF